jgi:hypothetical protein
VQEIKTVPYAPLSHPFVERLIGTIRRECLDRTVFWTAAETALSNLELCLTSARAFCSALSNANVEKGLAGIAGTRVLFAFILPDTWEFATHTSNSLH